MKSWPGVLNLLLLKNSTEQHMSLCSLSKTKIYCDLFYSLHLLIGASSKFIWTFIKTNGGGVVRNITNHFRSDSLPSTKQVYKKCLQKVSTSWPLTILIHCMCKHMNELKTNFYVPIPKYCPKASFW